MMSLKSNLLNMFAINLLIWWGLCKKDSNDACYIPTDCRIGPIHYLKEYENKQFLYKRNWDGLICEPRDQSFTIDPNKSFQPYDLSPNFNNCFTHKYRIITMLELRLPRNRKLFLGFQNLQNILKLLYGWKNYFLYFQLANAKGFEVKLLNSSGSPKTYFDSNTHIVHIINSEISFYADNKKIKSCGDLIKLDNQSKNYTIFQLVSFTMLLFLNCEYRWVLDCTFSCTLFWDWKTKLIMNFFIFKNTCVSSCIQEHFY